MKKTSKSNPILHTKCPAIPNPGFSVRGEAEKYKIWNN